MSRHDPTPPRGTPTAGPETVRPTTTAPGSHIDPAAPPRSTVNPREPMPTTWQRMGRNPWALGAAAVVLVLILAAIFL